MDEVRNELNVTPLVDVCLVLLIIFMVIMPMLARGKEVPLPRTKYHTEEPDKQQPIVAIDSRGKIYVDKEMVDDLEMMKARVRDEWAALGIETRVFLKASRETTYGKVYPVIIAIHDMGAPGIDLGTNEFKVKGEE